MIGRVVSVKSKNTATVLVERIAKHPLYKKTFARSKKYLVDDQIRVKEGDLVDIINCKPVSKNKHWKIVKVIGQSLGEITEQKLKKAAEKVVAEIMPEDKSADQKKSEEIAETPKTDKPKTKSAKKEKVGKK